MRNLLLLIAFLFLVSCKSTMDGKVVLNSETDANAMKTILAKVIYEPFINKAGRLIEGAGDFFLVYEDQSWFIKFSAGTVSREEVAQFKDYLVICSVIEMEGLWDTDDPNVQSRVGKYVGLYKIEKSE